MRVIEVVEIAVVGKVYAVLLQVHIENCLLQRLILCGKPAVSGTENYVASLPYR